MDKIIISDLELFCKHGVYKEEQILGQKFLICAELYMDTRIAGRTDKLDASINYGTVCHKIKSFYEEHTYQLIETAAEQLARYLLLEFELLKKIKLTLKKPWAPIGLPVKTVSVEITREWHNVYIALGSNMGDKLSYLNMAITELDADEDIKVLKVSDFITTAPYGVTDQDEFLNGCAKITTLYTPYELLDKLHEIEAKAERVRTLRWGPRTLDLDILFYDNLILDEEDLIIPHKDMKNRDFVLKPLKQIAPCFRHPVFNKTIEEMEEEL